jgi:hypothetical protein
MFQIDVPNREITALLPRQVSDRIIQAVFGMEGIALSDTDLANLAYSCRIDNVLVSREEFLLFDIREPVRAMIKGVWEPGTNIISFELTSLSMLQTDTPWPVTPSVLSPNGSIDIGSSQPPLVLGSSISQSHVTEQPSESSSANTLLQSLRQASNVDTSEPQGPAPRSAPAPRERRSILFNEPGNR